MIVVLLHALAFAEDHPAPVEPPAVEEPTPAAPTPTAPTTSEPAAPPTTPAEPITVSVTPPPSPIAALIPSADLPLRGPWGALFLLTLTGLALSSVGAIRRLGRMLRPTRLPPAAINNAVRGVRTVAALAFIGAIVALVPPSYEPAIPWMILACAVAVGWSVRDVLPDIVGGMVLRVEGRLARGQRLLGRGVVEEIGLLSTRLRDGQTIHTVPNRVLLAEPLRRDEAAWPAVEVWLSPPDDLPAARVREAISEAALTTPWGAPGQAPRIEQDPAQPTRWRTELRIIDARFACEFRGSLRERVLDHLSAQPPPGAAG